MVSQYIDALVPCGRSACAKRDRELARKYFELLPADSRGPVAEACDKAGVKLP